MVLRIENAIKIAVGALFVLVPLAFWPWSDYPLGVPKLLIFYVLTELAFAGFLALAAVRERYRPRLTPLAFSLFAFLVILSISAAQGADLERSVWGSIDRGTGLVFLWHLFALFLVIAAVFKKEDFGWFAAVNAATASVLSAIAFIQRFVWWPASLSVAAPGRAFALFDNAPFLAGYLLFTVFLALWLAVTRTERKERLLWLGLAALQIAAIFLTETRGALVALGTGGGFLALSVAWDKSRFDKAFRRGALIVLSAIVLLAAVLYVTPTAPAWKAIPGLNRFVSPSLQENLGQRVVLWNIAWQAFKERPFLGWGWDNFSLFFFKYYDPARAVAPINYIFSNPPDKPFSVPFEVLASAGVFGFLAYAGTYLSLGYALFRRRHANNKRLSAFLGAAFIAHFVQNLSLFDTLATYPLLFALLAFADLREREAEERLETDAAPRYLGGLAALFVAIFALAPFLNTLVPLARASSLHYWGRYYGGLEEFSNALPYWRAAIKSRSPYRNQIKLSYAVEARRAHDQQEEAPWELLHHEVLAVLRDLLARHPHNSLLTLELGNAYNSFSAFDASYAALGHRALEDAIRLAPKNAKNYVALARNELLKKNAGGALLALEKAAELHKGLSDPPVMLALLYYQMGDRSSAAATVDAIPEPLPRYAEENIILGDLYADLERYDRALMFYERGLRVPPIHPRKSLAIDARLKLGLIYNLVGEKERSRALLEGLKSELTGVEPAAARQVQQTLYLLGF